MATKNSKYFKVKTVEQFKILRYINIMFEENSLKLELLERNEILGTDSNGESLLFTYDYETEKVKVEDYI